MFHKKTGRTQIGPIQLMAMDAEKQNDSWRILDVNSKELEAILDVKRQEEKEKIRLRFYGWFWRSG